MTRSYVYQCKDRVKCLKNKCVTVEQLGYFAV